MRPLCQSARSTLFLVEDSEWGVPVVKKVLNQRYPGRRILARFLNEIEITQSLRIDGVRRPRKAEHDGDQHALYLDWVPGVPIRDAFQGRANDHVRIRDILRAAIGVGRILTELHQQRIIHRNVTADNIVVDVNGDVKVTLIDFALATKIERKRPYLGNPERLEGDLGYMAPEQCGRMNRTVDHRADLYSLGAVLYELLTGRLPFQTEDPVELVHQHMARAPESPSTIDPAVPRILSHVVLTLLAKNAEDRYQSGFGLQRDLQSCLDGLDDGKIGFFDLGVHDHSGQFSIPEKLYGREKEVGTLLSTFKRVAEGGRELMLIAGYSGTGKTALVNETHKPITARRGFFIHGKFDQFQRNVPYSALRQAFDGFVRLLLTESESTLRRWRARLGEALGAEGAVLTEVIEDLEVIVGPQPPVPEIGGKEAQNRFNYVFRAFVRAICDAEHPLVLFVDDLQWADSASLELLEALTTDPAGAHFLCVCAYRDNEVDASHPFLATVSAVEDAGTVVHRIEVGNLTVRDASSMIGESLDASDERTQELVRLVHEKTRGNAFFMHQFLGTLYEDDLLRFDFPGQRWDWDINRIFAQDMTDNVVELLGAKIEKLSEDLQHVLKVGACVGNRFDLATLAVASERSVDDVTAAVDTAMMEGLIVDSGQEFSFVHDRVQQAAYALIADDDRRRIHLRIGELFLESLDPQERIFDIVNQLNWGVDLIESPERRRKLAGLNLLAAQRARAAAAYAPALEYSTVGLGLVPAESWTSDYELTLSLQTEAAEAAYLCARFDDMEAAITEILAHARDLLDKTKAYEIKILAHKARNELLDAIDAGLEILAELGITFPTAPTPADTQAELAATMELLSKHSTADLLALPVMTDPKMIAAEQIMAGVNSSVYWARAELFPFFVFKSVRIAVEYGNTAVSAFGYSIYGVVLSGVVGDVAGAHEFGQLGLDLVERFGAKEWLTQLITPHYALIVPWSQHIRETMRPLADSVHVGFETGAIEYALINANLYCIHGFLMGMPLHVLEPETQAYSDQMRRAKQDTNLNFNEIYRQSMLNLRGRSDDPTILVGKAYDEAEMLPRHLEANDRTASFFVYFHRALLQYLFGDIPSAARNADEAKARLGAILAKLENATFRMLDSLVALARYEASDAAEREAIATRVEENQALLGKWADGAPMNFRHKFLLVEAERAHAHGDAGADELYVEAIELARQGRFIHEAALACERAGLHHLARADEERGRGYLRSAVHLYEEWGAHAKVEDLARSHPNLGAATEGPATPESRVDPGTAEVVDTSGLDLLSIVRSSQAVSEELDLEALLRKALRLVMENAGASRGLLLLGGGDSDAEGDAGALRVRAEAGVAADGTLTVDVVEGRVIVPGTDAAESVVNLARRTREALLVGDATQHPVFGADPHVMAGEVASIACLPLLHQAKLAGLLYLENPRTRDAFPQSRLTVLSLLASQVATAVVNARLYAALEAANESLERRVAERTVELEAARNDAEFARAIAEGANQAKSEFLANMSHELRTPLNVIIGYGEMLAEDLAETGADELAPDVARIEQSARHLLDLINTILDLSKVEAGRAEVFLETIEAGELMVELEMLAQPLAKANHNRLMVLSPPDLGTMRADVTKLRQCLLNLVSNACKFTESGSVILSAERETRDDAEVMHFRVRDTGIGMTPEQQAKVFDSFTQADGSIRRRFGGTGLGLTITRRLVELMGGEIAVESEVGKGTAFTLTVPVVGADDDETSFSGRM